jgi:hypothetical protein
VQCDAEYLAISYRVFSTHADAVLLHVLSIQQQLSLVRLPACLEGPQTGPANLTSPLAGIADRPTGLTRKIVVVQQHMLPKPAGEAGLL